MSRGSPAPKPNRWILRYTASGLPSGIQQQRGIGEVVAVGAGLGSRSTNEPACSVTDAARAASDIARAHGPSSGWARSAHRV